MLGKFSFFSVKSSSQKKLPKDLPFAIIRLMNFLTEKLGVQPENHHLILTAYFAFFVTGMTSTILGAILPDLRAAYELNYLVAGSLYSFHQIGNLCAVFLAGILPYIIGRKKSVSILFSTIFVGTLLITATGLPYLLMIAFTLTGIGRGNTSNITNVIVAESSRNKAAGLNLLHSIFAFGAFLSPFLLVLFTFFFRDSLFGGWRVTLWLLASFMVTVLFLFIFSSLSNNPEPRKRQVVNQDPISDENENLPPFYRSFDYWLNVSILLFYLCGESGGTGWLVTYFKDTGLMGQTFAQISSSLMWIMIMFGRLAVAFISSKVNKNVLIVIMAALNTAFFILMIATRSMPLIIAGLLGTGLSMSGIYPTTLSTMHRSYNSSPLASGFAIGIAVIGGISMPIIVGAIADKYGVSQGISTIAVALSVMLILTIVKLIRSKKISKSL